MIKIVEKGRSILLPFEITAFTVQSSISNEILYDGTVFESCKKEQTKNKIENTLKLSRLQGSIPKGAKLGILGQHKKKGVDVVDFSIEQEELYPMHPPV